MAQNKTINVLLKSIDYLEARRVSTNDRDIQKFVREKFPDIHLDGKHFDIVYAKRMGMSKFIELLSSSKLHNDSMILIDSIHKNPEKQQEWKNLITYPKITVSIDMYHCGAIFIRKEQVKEHFTIRI